MANENEKRLINYISYFESKTRFFAADQSGHCKDISEMPFYTYDEGVHRFVDEFEETNLPEPDYLQILKPYLEQRQDFNELIGSADFQLVRAILTYFVQGEKFCEGFWAGAVEKKYFINILYRLRELVEEKGSDQGGV